MRLFRLGLMIAVVAAAFAAKPGQANPTDLENINLEHPCYSCHPDVNLNQFKNVDQSIAVDKQLNQADPNAKDAI